MKINQLNLIKLNSYQIKFNHYLMKINPYQIILKPLFMLDHFLKMIVNFLINYQFQILMKHFLLLDFFLLKFIHSNYFHLLLVKRFQHYLHQHSFPYFPIILKLQNQSLQHLEPMFHLWSFNHHLYSIIHQFEMQLNQFEHLKSIQYHLFHHIHKQSHHKNQNMENNKDKKSMTNIHIRIPKRNSNNIHMVTNRNIYIYF